MINTIFTVLLFISDLIELTYDLGIATRKYVLPAVVYVYVRGVMMYEELTTMEHTLNVRNTPFTTGFSHGTRRLCAA